MARKFLNKVTLELRETESGVIDIDIKRSSAQTIKAATKVMDLAGYMVASAQKPITFQSLPGVGEVRLVVRFPNGATVARPLNQAEERA
jgi:hypothetical protein